MYYDSYNNTNGNYGSAKNTYGSDFYNVVRSNGGNLPPSSSSGTQTGNR